MTQTVAELGARTLRKLGVSVVALSAQPAVAATVTSADVVTEVLRNLGIFASEVDLAGLGSGLTFNRAQMGTKALIKLAIIASDETPAPLDQALAVDKFLAVHDGLLAIGIVNWGPDAIPTSVVEHYVIMTAHLLAPEFGKGASPEASTEAVETIRKMGMVRGASGRALKSVQAVHNEMQGLGLVSWTLDTIPASMMQAYAAAATSLMGEEAGKPFDAAAYGTQMTRVRMLAMGGPAGQALAEAKVLAVHNLLDARGKTRWALWDVPDFVEEIYVFMAATWLAPELGVKVDPTWWQQAEMNLDRVTSIPTSYRPVVAEYF